MSSKISLNELRLIMNDTEKEYKSKQRELLNNCKSVEIKEISGNTMKLSEDYNFSEGLKELNKIRDNLISMRSTISLTNNMVKIKAINGNEITLQEGICLLQEKRKTLELLDEILEKTKKSTERKENYGGNSQPYYEIINPNFDEKELIEERNKIRNELNHIETEVANANILAQIDIIKI